MNNQSSIPASPQSSKINEQQWETRLATTTEQQWQRILHQIRQDIAAGRITPLAEVLR
ncbi:MAG: hypothetical protein F6J87_21800 [Spirulina sp. SIO3F2]|nr:hypothetical protein [Spirulina sp. SIO3F2]